MKSNMRRNSVSMWVYGLILLVAGGVYGTATGAEYTWVDGTTGNWTVAENWGGTVPVAGDTAYIRNGTVSSDNACLQSRQITIYLGGGTEGQAAFLNTQDIAARTYVQAGGSLAIGKDYCQLGLIDIDGGAYNSDTNHYIKGATLTLNSGSYTSQNLNLGHDSEGFFIQNGGTATVTGLASIGYRVKGTYTLNLGEATFNNFKVGTVGVGEFIQKGGNSSFNSDTTNISDGNDGTFTVEGGVATFKRTLRVGATNGKTGTLDLKGGTTHFEMVQGSGSYSVSLGATAGATGVMKISGTATVDFVGNDVHVGNSGTGRIEQSGGTFSLNRGWLNIGENGAGSYLMSGGNLNTTKGALCIGRRNVGTMEVSGTGVVNANTAYVGMFSQKTGNSQLTIKTGGTFNATKLFIGDGYGNEPSTNIGTSTVLVEGGRLNVTGETIVANYIPNGTGQAVTGVLTLKGGTNSTPFLRIGLGAGANGTANIEGGTNDFKNVWISARANSKGTFNISGGSNTSTDGIYVGLYGGTDGTFNISGGTNTFTKVSVGYTDPSNTASSGGTLNLTGGTGTTINRLNLGDGNGTRGVLNITGGEHQILLLNAGISGSSSEVNMTSGTVTLSNESYIGGNTGDNTFTISGGTFNIPTGADFFIGNKTGDTLATMTVKGTGTFSHLNGNTIVTAGRNANEVNTVYLQENGKLDLNWLSLGQNWNTHAGTAAVDISGGTLNIKNVFRIGHQDRGEATISGGIITVQDTIDLDNCHLGSVLNINGSGATINTVSLNLNSTGTANFTADALTFTDDGQWKAPLSTIKASGNATVASALNVDMTNYKFDGIAFLDTDAVKLVSANGTLTYNSTSVNVQGPWNVIQNGNDLELKLDESKIGQINLSTDGIASGILGTSGWVKITGEGNLAKVYVGDGQDMLSLVAWAQDTMPNNSGVTVGSEGSFLTFSNLDLGEDNIAYMSWNLDDYNLRAGAEVEFQNVPEPATWALLLLGFCFLLRKRFR